MDSASLPPGVRRLPDSLRTPFLFRQGEEYELDDEEEEAAGAGAAAAAGDDDEDVYADGLDEEEGEFGWCKVQ